MYHQSIYVFISKIENENISSLMFFFPGEFPLLDLGKDWQADLPILAI